MRTGPSRVVHSWALSSVTRVPTTVGDVCAKAVHPHFAAEPRVTAWLSARFPDRVPDVLAVTSGAQLGGVTLMRAFAGALVEEPAVAVLSGVAGSLAALQRGCLPHAEELLAVGAADRRLAVLPVALDAVLADGVELALLTATERSALAGSRAWCADRVERLAGCGMPETLVHGDLHLGNVAVHRGGPPVLFDWTDACVSHPVLDVAQLVMSAGALPVQAWVEPWRSSWRDAVGDAAVSRALAVAAPVERMFQAVTYEGIARAVGPVGLRPLFGVQAAVLRGLLALRG